MKYAVGIVVVSRRREPDGKKNLWKNCGASAKSGPSLWQARCRSGELATNAVGHAVCHGSPAVVQGKAAGKGLFRVDVWKLRQAFQWLKEHNPYDFGVEWR